MRSSALASVIIATGTIVSLLPSGCSSDSGASSTYFERSISPILQASCVRTNTGASCHVATPKGNAFGNLDTATFAGVDKRRDLLADYGPYGQPAFLLKVIPNGQIDIQSFDGTKVTLTADIKHTGGPILDPTASGFQVLKRWVQNGATENNGGRPPATVERKPCNPFVPREAGFNPAVDPPGKDFATFKNRTNTVIGEKCSAGNCHGTIANELYFTCGGANATPEQVRWNYFAAGEYLAKVAEQSELLRRPLAPAVGGSFHEGGVVFETQEDPGYAALRDWSVEHGPAKTDSATQFGEGFAFFSNKVQPVLAKKGCMMMQCHSAAMFHDYRLRGGSGGAFSFSATRRNYELSLAQLSIESDDIDASRMIRKNLYRPDQYDGGVGELHRGGPLFEDFGTTPARGELCDTAKAGQIAPNYALPPYDYQAGDLDKIPPYCVIREWLRVERNKANLTPFTAVVYVKRSIPTGPNRFQDFDVYTPGADLRLLKVAVLGTAISPGTDESLNAKCGLDKATADIKRPSVSWDGKKVAFAARTSASEPLQIYEMNADGSGCAKHPDINAGAASQNGLLVHNFDPTYSPPDGSGQSMLVFASTRGNIMGGPYDYSGPQRTPSDPTKPNANIYVFEPAAKKLRQLTFLLNTERMPSFMQDGRLIFTAEKRAPNFYQLALRRVNLDGGDYHPLFAQRSSVGFHQATSVVELSDKDFATVMSEPGVPHGAGQLAIINRSIGLDFGSTSPADYIIDASVINPAAPASPEPRFFLRSLGFPDPGGAGKPGIPGTGVYASPSPLPNGNVLVSYGAATDPAAFGGDYDLYVVNKITGEKTKLVGDAGTAEVDAVAVFGRPAKGIFRSTFDEANGHTQILAGRTEADVTLLSTPVMASLVFQNTPTGRPLENDLKSFDLYEDLPPPPEYTAFDGSSNVVSDAFGKVYVKRRKLGAVPVLEDGSSHFVVPGGVPVVMGLPATKLSTERKLPRFQREQMVFAPGEYAHQSFRPQFFDGLCGQCHGSISGRGLDASLKPDMLTQASEVLAKSTSPTNLNLPPQARGKIEGPPPTP
ncbi:MAG: hypothetical protein U0174_13770 [Polyangiaceae bacterium]